MPAEPPNADRSTPSPALPTPRTVLLASLRGWCAGVERAVDAVRETLALQGPPIYVRKQIVHNIHVVRELEDQGVVFVDYMSQVPEGGTVVLSAHGVAPEVHEKGRERGLNVIDATCPLVTKVHKQALRFVRDGFTIVMIGHENHEETIGTMGEAPDHIVLVQDEADVDALDIGDPQKLSYITQTTLSVDETVSIIRRLKERYPQIVGPEKEDICYATTNRQAAVKELARQVDLVLVIGSENSSNSVRLAEVARDEGTPAHRIDDESEIRDEWLEGIEVVGITSGASAPETLVARVCDFFRDRGTLDIRAHQQVDEGVHFMLPTELRLAMAERHGGKP